MSRVFEVSYHSDGGMPRGMCPGDMLVCPNTMWYTEENFELMRKCNFNGNADVRSVLVKNRPLIIIHSSGQFIEQDHPFEDFTVYSVSMGIIKGRFVIKT